MLHTREAQVLQPLRFDLPGEAGEPSQPRYWSCVCSPVRAHDGAVTHVVIHVQDATDRVLLQERFAAHEARLKEESERRALAEAERKKLYAVFEDAHVGIAIFRGPEHVIEYANPFECKLWGRPREQVIGKPMRVALPETAAQGVVETNMDALLASGEAKSWTELPIRFDRKGTGELDLGYFNFVHVPYRDAAGRVEGLMVYAWEVTEAVLARQRATQLTADLHSRIDFEQKLIGIVSHDLRNPLSAIQFAAGMLVRREPTTPAVLRIQASAQRALTLVRDLLDFTQARLGGQIPVQPGPADLHDIARAVVDEVSAVQPERTVSLTEEGDGRGSWDAARIAQVLDNLVTNAVKHCAPGTPVRVTSRGVDERRVSLSVHNEGAPIPPEQLERIFEPLERGTSGVDSARSVGLGLYIVRSLVQAHGGSVDVTSSADGGTTFTAHLPRRAVAPPS